MSQAVLSPSESTGTDAARSWPQILAVDMANRESRSSWKDFVLSMIAETGPWIFTEMGPLVETCADGGAHPGEAGWGCAAGAMRWSGRYFWNVRLGF